MTYCEIRMAAVEEQTYTNYPEARDEFDKCRDFLQNYADGVDSRPYMVQLVRLVGILMVYWTQDSFRKLPN